jgi:cellulose synthase operon protein C
MGRFLDGTARFYGSNELPTEDQGASALIIEADGKSHLVVTPILPASQNVTDSQLTFRLSDEGEVQIDGQSRVLGALAPSYRQAYASDVGQRSAFEAAWSRSYPGIAVSALKFSDLNQLEKPVELKFQLISPRLSSDPNEFRPFGVSSGYLETYAPLSRRKFDLQLEFPFTTRFRYRCLPPPRRKFIPPHDVHLTSAFGSLDVTYKTDDAGAVTVVGALALSATRIPPADYAVFREFLRRVDHGFETPLGLSPGGDHAAK